MFLSDNQNLNVTCPMDKWNEKKVFCPFNQSPSCFELLHVSGRCKVFEVF